jgi:NodT family efflux transporter outer membrane factor (OMF) lipoprotein
MTGELWPARGPRFEKNPGIQARKPEAGGCRLGGTSMSDSAVCVLVVILAALLASCQTTPEAPSVPVEVPEAFSGTGEDELPDHWWRSFDDPALDRLVERALEGNPGIWIAWDRLAAAEAAARKAGAELYPSLDAGVAAQRTRTRTSVETPFDDDETVTSYSTALSLDLAASWEIDVWGRVRASRDAAALTAAARAEDVRAVAIILSAEVAANWYRLVEQRGQIRVLEAQIDTNERVLELVTLRFQQGKVGAADVLRQRQLVEAGRENLVVARATEEVLENRLAVLLGLPPGRPVTDPADELVTLPPLPATGVPAVLVERRPDVQSALSEVLAADRVVAAAVADRYPRLSITARAETFGEDAGDLFENWLAAIAGNLVAPILDGGRRAAEVDRTRAVASEALNGYGQIVLDAFEEVENALVKERRQRERIESIEKQRELSRQIITQTRQSYANGALDYLRVLEALITDQGLERALLSARRELVEYRIELCRAIAGGWEMDRPEDAAGKETAKR